MTHAPSSVALLRRVNKYLMTNDEILMTKEFLNPNSEWETRSFELRHSFDIRHSGFVIVQHRLTAAATE
jgi:hypothetical protein